MICKFLTIVVFVVLQFFSAAHANPEAQQSLRLRSCEDFAHKIGAKGVDLFDRLADVVELAKKVRPDSTLALAPRELIKGELRAGECFAMVGVYISHPDRLELWTFFLIDQALTIRYAADDMTGDYIPYANWKQLQLKRL